VAALFFLNKTMLPLIASHPDFIAGLTVLEVAVFGFTRSVHLFYYFYILCFVTAMVVLAFIARVKSRLGGFIILFAGILLSLSAINTIISLTSSSVMMSLEPRLGLFRLVVQIILVLGALGLSPLKTDTPG